LNQRSFEMIRMLRAMVGALAAAAERLAGALAVGLDTVRQGAAHLAHRPKVYFEEWDDPMITSIAWISELIEAAGGDDVFADRAAGKAARERIVAAEEIIARALDVIIGSWCGKKFLPENARPGFGQIPAVRDGALHAIK
jgi:iron complex transport system substrate-binding protein